MTEQSLAQPAHETASRERGTCSGCGTTSKALTAPKANVSRDYKGEMFCLHCNPRFFTLEMHFSSLERLA